MHVDRDMMKPLRDEYEAQNLLTHMFYLDELVEKVEAGTSPIDTITSALAMIEMQATIDLWFQERFNTALDYCEPETHGDDGHIVFRCMLFETQREVVVQPTMNILSGSDGM